ncbi:carboxypeptidase-like regulatory domain-containing protein [uncultured Pontibacter sp.]|uniref:carboxypeptidase-like regulatory domain-containing protein n=1 Tax=uncultured Pontibacter sp. TaxID=453356 RepID=UPI00260D635B|nr:carboxypeptidase-like regulatory domain-containing protein [uncultured Pontibacter sp.]
MRHDKLQTSEWGLEEHPSTELLRQYEEGVLPPASNYDVERHLLDCEMCEDILSGMALSDRGRTKQARNRIWQRIRTRLRRKHRPRALHGLADWRVALGVLMMFSSLGLLLFYHYTRTLAQERANVQASEVLPPTPEELLARTIDAAIVLDIPAPPVNPSQQLSPAKTAVVQNEASLQGRVLAEDGQGIAGVLLEVQGSQVRMTSDRHGNFSLPLPAGEYEVRISKQGYPPLQQTLNSPAKDVTLHLSQLNE